MTHLHIVHSSDISPKSSKPSRLDRALAIRDAALFGIQRHGIVKITPALGPFHTLKIGHFEVSYRSSLQKHAAAQRKGIKIPYDRIFPHGLDIWDPTRKVLNIEWLESYKCEIVSFRGGAWEEIFLHVVGKVDK